MQSRSRPTAMYSTKIVRNVTRKIVIKTTVHACATPKLTDAQAKNPQYMKWIRKHKSRQHGMNLSGS